MGVTKTTHVEGSGPQAQSGKTVTIEYTGYLKDTSKPDNKGNKYVSGALTFRNCRITSRITANQRCF